MEIQHIRLFLAVAEHRGVNAAAAAEEVAPPTVSQAIRRLERELGVLLFHRVGSGMELSSAGYAFLGPARRIMRATLRAEASASGDQLRGRLEIHAAPGLAFGPLGTLIAEFTARWPHVDIKILDFEPDYSVSSMLRNGTCEIVVSHLPQGGTRGFDVIELGTQEPWALFPPDVEVGDGPVAYADLATLPLVVTRGGAEVRAIRDAIADGGVPPRPVVIVDQREVRFALVAAGIGSTFVEKTIAREQLAMGAVARPLEPTIEVPFGLIVNPEMLSPTGGVFVEMVKKAVARGPL